MKILITWSKEWLINKLREVIMHLLGIKYLFWEKESSGREMLIHWEIELIKLGTSINSLDNSHWIICLLHNLYRLKMKKLDWSNKDFLKDKLVDRYEKLLDNKGTNNKLRIYLYKL
jgi:hypothetical protein